MDRPKIGFRIENHTGSSTQIGAFQVTPQSQSISIHLPFGGFVYNRPVAVVVERDGTIDRIPIVDVTTLVLISLAGFSFFFSMVLAGQVARTSRSRRK